MDKSSRKQFFSRQRVLPGKIYAVQRLLEENGFREGLSQGESCRFQIL